MPQQIIQSICGYCSTGCSLGVHLQDGLPVGLTPSPDYPVNHGVACPKGWEALSPLDASDRATTPMIKDASGNLTRVNWDSALRHFTQRFKGIQAEHGSESVAFLGSGQLVTEEVAFLGALGKFGMGMLHGDGNTRQCMATTAVAYKEAFGFDAPPYAYQDLEESDVIVFVGSNLCLTHPVMWERVMRNHNNPKIIVVDPRMTETAMGATMHLPVYPKSDLSLIYGVARILMERNWINREYIESHTNGFEEFSQHAQLYTLDKVSRETHISANKIEEFAEIIHSGHRVSFWWTMGVNQSHQGVRTAQSIINLALMTGNMGRPGTGANSITGQCNAMGSRLFSNTTNLLGGHDFTNEQHRNKIANILNIDSRDIPSQNSWSYDKIIEGILKRKIRGLWIVCTNTAHSWINQNMVREVLDRLDFLVVQDMYNSTETVQMADLVFPAAGWGEKEGTFINSERRIGVVNRVAKAPGKALSDFNIFRLISEYWGCSEMFKEWSSPEKVFQILKKCSAGQPCDITGVLDYRMIEERGGIQWPFSEDSKDLRIERRLFEDGHYYHADGRARFLYEKPRPVPEVPNKKFPFLLLTGRGSASQWHTQTRTSKSAVLRKLYTEIIYVEMNPKDAKGLSIEPNTWVTIRSQRGRLRAKVFLTNNVKPGQIFIPMHYPQTNQLTDAVFDPYSRQPGYKSCAARIEA